MHSIINDIHKQLSMQLPGLSAQLKMGSDIRIKDLGFMPENSSTKQSGVLILLYPKLNSIYSVLIQRPEYDGAHGGQMAFPGGKSEQSDIDISATAIRETFEEIGVIAKDIKLLGKLTKLFIPPSNYNVFPFVGYVDYVPAFKPQLSEVAEIVEYPIEILKNDAIIESKIITIRNNLKINAPYFSIQGKTVWGATAMILSEFKEILNNVAF